MTSQSLVSVVSHASVIVADDDVNY